MAYNEKNAYEVDSHIVELYDRLLTYTDDVGLICRLIHSLGPLRILEPFTGTGRILLPLAVDGHTVIGFDQSRSMIERAQIKAAELPKGMENRVAFLEGDVIESHWPVDDYGGYDLVILAGNCLYELAIPEEQETVIRKAAEVLKPGGYIYVDNDHMEGELALSWQDPTPERRGMAGDCSDGSRVDSWIQTVWFDAPRRLARFKRWIEITRPNGEKAVREYIQQKHPVSMSEVKAWLEKYGFVIEQVYGGWDGSAYCETAQRAIFWARKCEQAFRQSD